MSDEKAAEKAQQGEEQISAEEIKSQIKNVFNQNLEEEGEGTQQYEHNKAQGWINKICEQVMDKLIRFRKPFKYVVTCMIVQKNGAGISSATMALWDNMRDSLHSVPYEGDHVHCITTVYWAKLD